MDPVNDVPVEELRARLAEAEATLEAIRTGAADAVVGEGGDLFHRAGAERNYLTFFSAMNEGGVTLDGRGIVLHGNPRFAAMVGRSFESLRGTDFLTCVATADRPSVARLLASPDAGACEASLVTPGAPAQVRLSLTRADGQQPELRCLVVTDLSERAAALSELRIAGIAFESQEAMTVTDNRGVIVRVNRAFTKMTGYSAGEAIGHLPRFLRSASQNRAFYHHIWEALTKSHYWQGELWNRRKSGERYALWLTISAVCAPDGSVTHYVGAFSEITSHKEAEAEIYRLAYFDSLTGLPNRRLLLDRLKQALATSARSGQYGAVLFLDLDNFKTLNDTQGHDAGDELLREVARRLLAGLREVDTVARLGGDEFLLLLENMGLDEDAACQHSGRVAEKLREALAQPYPLGQHEFLSTVSIGVSLFHDHRESIEELLKRADLALYKAKDCGRNTVQFFDPILQASLNARVSLESDLRQALAKGEFLLKYQPQVDDARQVTGAEVLLRWQHPRRGLVQPADFIAFAEASGLILPIGEWVLRTACEQLKTWATQPGYHDLALAVNVSLRQFRQPDFVAIVRRALDETGANPTLLKIELTESMMVEDVGGTTQKMRALKDLGTSISIDDFGTGYSSLSYLMQLPIDQLKVATEFVANVPNNHRDAIVTQTIINLATNLGMDVIAEGVESEAQLQFLQSRGCHAFQGFLFSRPVRLDAFEQLTLSPNAMKKAG